jgi:hypothetical protein
MTLKLSVISNPSALLRINSVRDLDRIESTISVIDGKLIESFARDNLVCERADLRR